MTYNIMASLFEVVVFAGAAAVLVAVAHTLW